MELEEKLRHSEIIKASDDNNTVSMGSLVVLKDVEFDEVETYRIVGSTEADPDNGKISNESPVGMAVLGHNVGETVEVFVGENTILSEIMEITQ